MKNSLPLAAALALASALAAGAASCGGETVLKELCASDTECIDSHEGNPNWFCHDRGQCACLNDDACHDNEHCNALDAGGDGLCHPNRLCDLNSDCKAGERCGPDGVCRAGCVNDLQCELGKICDPISQVCKDGCWTHGDCKLRQACMCKSPSGEFDEACVCDNPEHEGCSPGRCIPDVCPDKSFCDYGELCLPGEDGQKHCVKDDRGPYCEKCTATPGETTFCGSKGPNFCLVDTNDPARRANFCGVDCDDNQECPNGYDCVDVLQLTQQTCSGSSQCVPPPSAPGCEEDEDCPSGAQCVNGLCAGMCFGSEGGTRGFCSCVTDDECPQDTCGTDRRCNITRKPCIPGPADSCRGAILCVNDGFAGYCRIGSNCAPADGLSCAEVRAGVK